MPGVGIENLINESHHRVQLRLGTRWVATKLRQRTGNCLQHHASMHTELRRHTGDRPTPNSCS